MSEIEEMELFVGTKRYKLGNAPVGLLLLNDGTIICKSEYHTNGSCDCTIVESGENYCGEGDEAECRSLMIR